MSDACYSCRVEASLETQPPRERIHVEEGWRIAHAFSAALPGWLVVVPRRHVESLDALTAPEAETLGPLLTDASAALREVAGCAKTYVALFAEAEGFAHVHFHVVPRAPGLPPDQHGPRIFQLLGRPREEWVAEDDQDRLAAELGAAIARRRA